jgi:hypothetical protein
MRNRTTIQTKEYETFFKRIEEKEEGIKLGMTPKELGIQNLLIS